MKEIIENKWYEWIALFIVFIGLLCFCAYVIFDLLNNYQDNLILQEQKNVLNLSGNPIYINSNVTEISTETICRCTNPENAIYKAMTYCVQRGYANDTKWNQIKSEFYNDNFIKNIAIYNCTKWRAN